MKALIIGGVAAIVLAGTAGLMVQGKQLRDERADVVRLEETVSGLQRDLRDAQAKASRLESENATQAYEAAIVCQGEGAELFAAGRRVGRAEGAAQCPVR